MQFLGWGNIKYKSIISTDLIQKDIKKKKNTKQTTTKKETQHLQPKDTDWVNGYQNMTHIYAVYKKPTSDQKTHIH